MDCVVFLPGTMGSVLSTPDGEVVWPPTVAEAQFGYTRKAKLLRPDLVVSDIVRSVACFGVYQPLVDQLNDAGFPEAGPGNSGGGNRLNILAYDWRLDLERLSNQLANSLDAIAKTGVQSITIVAHSMGGLIARLALESGKHDGEAWFPKVKSFISVGTPHLGAPPGTGADPGDGQLARYQRAGFPRDRVRPALPFRLSVVAPAGRGHLLGHRKPDPATDEHLRPGGRGQAWA